VCIPVPCAPLSELRFKFCEARLDFYFHLITKSGEHLPNRDAEYDFIADRDFERRRDVEPFMACDSFLIVVAEHAPKFALAESRASPMYADVVRELPIDFFVVHPFRNFFVRPFPSSVTSVQTVSRRPNSARSAGFDFAEWFEFSRDHTENAAILLSDVHSLGKTGA
jgi:hypothetical protein